MKMKMKVVGIGALLFGMGCGGVSEVSLSTRFGAATVAPVYTQSVRGELAAPMVAIDRVRMVVRELELERDAEEDGLELEAGPFLLDLSGDALSGVVVHQISAAIPDGTYDELEIEIHKLEDGAPPEDGDPGLHTMYELGASIVVDGTVDGEPYSFVSSVNETLELEGVFQIGDAVTENLTLNIDPSAWFVSSTGDTMDPRADMNRSAIEANIKGSLGAFEDDDADGEEDEDDGTDGLDDDGIEDEGTDDDTTMT